MLESVSRQCSLPQLLLYCYCPTSLLQVSQMSVQPQTWQSESSPEKRRTDRFETDKSITIDRKGVQASTYCFSQSNQKPVADEDHSHHRLSSVVRRRSQTRQHGRGFRKVHQFMREGWRPHAGVWHACLSHEAHSTHFRQAIGEFEQLLQSGPRSAGFQGPIRQVR